MYAVLKLGRRYGERGRHSKYVEDDGTMVVGIFVDLKGAEGFMRTVRARHPDYALEAYYCEVGKESWHRVLRWEGHLPHSFHHPDPTFSPREQFAYDLLRGDPVAEDIWRDVEAVRRNG